MEMYFFTLDKILIKHFWNQFGVNSKENIVNDMLKDRLVNTT